MGKPLAVLDANKDLNTSRGTAKRGPIAFGQENTQAIFAGVARGTYDLREIMAVEYPGADQLQAVSEEEAEEDSGDEGGVPSGAPVMDDQEGDDMDDQEGNGMDEEEGTEDEEGDEDEEGTEDEEGDDDDDGIALDQDLSTGEDGENIAEDVNDEDDDEEGEDDNEDEEENDGMEEIQVGIASIPAFDAYALGLKEINNLAHFSVSSHKPGNGVAELLSDDLEKYWQSDGQQPHLLTIHFVRRVEIRAIRFYVDYNQDESYTPTNLVFYAGTGHHDLIRFADVALATPVGWQNVPVSDAGGGFDGRALCCYIVQVHVKENHQNGKDTHLRGIKLYAIDTQRAMPFDEDDDEVERAPDPATAEILAALRRWDRNASRMDNGFTPAPAYMLDVPIR